jgi:hypothetical protein
MATNPILLKSPQILYDLYESDGLEQGLININERGRAELQAMQAILISTEKMLKLDFPIKVTSNQADCIV